MPASYRPVFETGREEVVGPVTDRWGTLITALIPIRDPASGRPLAVMGLDVAAEDWNREILARCLGPALVDLLLMVLVFMLYSRQRLLVRLKRSEEKYKNIVENATNLFYIQDTAHHLTYVSPQSREYFQCEPEQARLRWAEFVTDNPINRRGKELTDRTIATGQPQGPYELELKGRQGKKSVVLVNEKPILENGKTVAVAGSLTDITERKKMEEELRRERDNLKKALEEIKTLRGILPICSICKKIRDDEGYWKQLENYLEEHTEVRFSHGLCQECAEKFYPDL